MLLNEYALRLIGNEETYNITKTNDKGIFIKNPNTTLEGFIVWNKIEPLKESILNGIKTTIMAKIKFVDEINNKITYEQTELDQKFKPNTSKEIKNKL